MPVYKDEKRKTWYVKYSAKDQLTGKRRQILKRGFTTKRDAQKWEAQQKASDTSGAPSITFRQLAEQYYAFNRPQERTRDTQIRRLEIHFSGMEMPLNKLTKAFMADWYIKFVASDLSTSSKNLLLRIIRSIFRFGSDHYGYPNLGAGLKLIKGQKRKYTTWTVDQFNQFIATVDRPFYKILFTFYFSTGCRCSEALGLLRSDFDLEDGTVHIQRHLKNSASDRVLKLPPLLLDELRPLLDQCDENDKIFPIDATCVLRAMQKYTEISGVPKIRIHDLRHSFASNAIGNGNDIIAVSKYLGHASVKITMEVYAHLLEKNEDLLVSNINSWMEK